MFKMERNRDQSFLQKIFRSIFSAVELSFSIIIGFTIIFPVLSIALLLNELVRIAFKLYLWLVYNDRIVLNDDEVGSNYALMAGKRDRHMVLYLGEVEGTLDVDNISENYQKRVIENKVYKKLTYALHEHWLYMCLKKCENFNIRNHVRYYPGTEDRIVNEEELLQKILPDLTKAMIRDPTIPQWEEVIIPYYKERTDANEEKSISLRIIRMNHSYMDGASMLLMIANTFCEEGFKFPYVIDPCKPLKVPRLAMLFHKLTSLAWFTSLMIRNIISPPFVRARKSRFTVNYKDSGEVLFGWTRKFPIEYFQSIKEKSGVSMPAIVTTVLSGAVRNLELRNIPTIKSKNTLNVISKSHPLWLVAGMFPYNMNKPGNNHVVIESAVDLSHMSGCERLALTNDEFGRLSKNPIVNVYFWYAKVIGRAPAFIAKFFVSLAYCPIILSNIPLCTKPVKLWNKKCKSIVGWVPLMGRTGLGVVSVRYADHFRYCVQVDSAVFTQEELTFLLEKLEEQVEQLFYETAHLKRKISTDVSLFRREKEEIDKERQKKLSSMAKISLNKNDIQEKSDIFDKENDEKDSPSTKTVNCGSLYNYITNNNNSVDEFRNGDVTNSKYSIIFKLRDNFQLIRDGFRKIKEQ